MMDDLAMGFAFHSGDEQNKAMAKALRKKINVKHYSPLELPFRNCDKKIIPSRCLHKDLIAPVRVALTGYVAES